MHFASPYYLWLLSALVPMIAYYVWRTLQGGASIQISSVEGVVRAPKTVRYWLRHLPFALRLAALALLIVAGRRVFGRLGDGILPRAVQDLTAVPAHGRAGIFCKRMHPLTAFCLLAPF